MKKTQRCRIKKIVSKGTFSNEKKYTKLVGVLRLFLNIYVLQFIISDYFDFFQQDSSLGSFEGDPVASQDSLAEVGLSTTSKNTHKRSKSTASPSSKGRPSEASSSKLQSKTQVNVCDISYRLYFKG